MANAVANGFSPSTTDQATVTPYHFTKSSNDNAPPILLVIGDFKWGTSISVLLGGPNETSSSSSSSSSYSSLTQATILSSSSSASSHQKYNAISGSRSEATSIARIDLIIGTDLLYCREIVSPLLQTVRDLLVYRSCDAGDTSNEKAGKCNLFVLVSSFNPGRVCS